MTRIPIQLNDDSLTALRNLAKQEYRDVRQQAAWIIYQELARLGLLITYAQTKSSFEHPKQEGCHVTE